MLYATLQQEKCLYLRFGGSELLESVHPYCWRAQGKSGVTEHDWGRKGGEEGGGLVSRLPLTGIVGFVMMTILIT